MMDEPNAKLAWVRYTPETELRCPCGIVRTACQSRFCRRATCVRNRALTRCPGCGRPVTPPGLPARP